jgi:hypothetical protein
MSDDMVEFLARAQYVANSWWRAVKDDDDGLGRYKMHGDVRLRALEWEHLDADEQDDFLQSARAIITAIEASGRRIVQVEPTPAMTEAGGSSIIRPDVYMGGVPPGAKRRAKDVWADMIRAAAHDP